jgi:two-component system, NarL family, nitrate/nitrite response regulator NarL
MMISNYSTMEDESENPSCRLPANRIPNILRGGDMYVNVITVLAEPNVLVRKGIASILGAANFWIVHSADSICSLSLSILSQYLSQYTSILLVIGASDGPEEVARQIELFKATQLTGRVAVLADKCNLNDVLPLFRAGANAYLANVKSCDALIKSLELVMLGETIMPSGLLALIPGHDEKAIDCDVRGPKQIECNAIFARLSVQENRILQCLIEGVGNKVIARKMDLAEATVKVHLKSIFRKIAVRNRTQAVVWAVTNGLASQRLGVVPIIK